MRTLSEIITPWRFLNWPNRITLLRLLLVAPFVMAMQRQQAEGVYRYVALGILAAMAASDLLDGILARRLNAASRLGAILDPLADKVTIICAAVLLSLDHSSIRGAQLPQWVAVLIVGKDLWVLVGFVVLFLLTGSVHVRPSRLGKFSTAAQLAMVLAVLLSPDINHLGGRAGFQLARALWLAVSVLCVLSVISYTRLGLILLAQTEQDDSARHVGKDD